MASIHLLNRGAATAIAALACATARDAVAQTVSSEVIVTGARVEGAARRTDPNVQAFDAADIEARAPASAVELLRSVPDLFVQQAGARGSVASLFMRGAKPNFTLVLVDGVEVNDPTNTRGGSYDFANMGLDDIARVEVVRGPTSAVYGSGAVGGVINFLSKPPSGPAGGDVEASTGGYGFWSAGFHLGGPVGPANGRFGVSYVDNGAPVQGSGFQGLTLDSALAGQVADTALRLSARFGSDRAQAFPDSSGGPRLAVLRSVDHRRADETVLALQADHRPSDAWGAQFNYSLYDRTAKSRSPGVAGSAQDPSGIPPNTDDIDFIRQEATLVGRVRVNAGLNAAFGLDGRYEHGVDDGTLTFGRAVLPTRFERTRREWGVFAEADATPMQNVELAASLRYDDFGVEGDRWDPKLRAAYTIASTGTRIEANWARAFKLPSFYALGNPIVGDPTLRPELADNVELGVSQPLARSGDILKLVWFDTRYRNLIDFQPGPVPRLVNRAGVRIQGGEGSAAFKVGETLTVEAHLSYTTTRDVQTGQALRDVPNWLAGGTLSWTPAPRATITATLFHVGALTDNAIPTGDERLPGHQRVDLAATYRLTAATVLSLNVENAASARYQEVIGFPAPRTVIRAGAKTIF